LRPKSKRAKVAAALDDFDVRLAEILRHVCEEKTFRVQCGALFETDTLVAELVLHKPVTFNSDEWRRLSFRFQMMLGEAGDIMAAMRTELLDVVATSLEARADARDAARALAAAADDDDDDDEELDEKDEIEMKRD
jgi:hypothetical protein